MLSLCLPKLAVIMPASLLGNCQDGAISYAGNAPSSAAAWRLFNDSLHSSEDSKSLR